MNLLVARKVSRSEVSPVETMDTAEKSVVRERVHSKTRLDHSIEMAEDYVEAIQEKIEMDGRCRAIDLARRFSVSQATVNRTIGRLVRDGLVLTEPYGPLRLTAPGKRLASAAKERHTAVYNLLVAIGVDLETAAIDSEGMEHHASPKTIEAIRRFLKQSVRTK